MKFRFHYIFLFVILVAACKKDQFEQYDRTKDSDYFVDSTGVSTVYLVNEITFDDFSNSSDTSNYQIMEINDSYFTDNLGRRAVKIDRYKRISDTSIWKYLNSWYAVKEQDMVERIEDNKRIVKLSFPITQDAVWNTNAFNLDNVINLYYGFINQKYSQDTFKFKNALSVESASIKNEYKERSFKEIYAKGIGLVYRNQVAIDKNGTLNRGYKIIYRLLKHEK